MADKKQKPEHEEKLPEVEIKLDLEMLYKFPALQDAGYKAGDSVAIGPRPDDRTKP